MLWDSWPDAGDSLMAAGGRFDMIVIDFIAWVTTPVFPAPYRNIRHIFTFPFFDLFD